MSGAAPYSRDVPHPTLITSAVLSTQDIPYCPLTTAVKKANNKSSYWDILIHIQ